MDILFPDIKRTYRGPAKYSELSYKYLNRSARPESEAVRKLLNDWYQHYPESEKKELKSRIQGNCQEQFLSAIHELFLHEIFRKMGYVVEVHPRVSQDNDRFPDFLLSAPNEKIYVEALTINDYWFGTKEATARVNQIRDYLNDLESIKIMYCMDIYGSPETPPPVKKWKNEIEAWSANHDPDSMICMEPKDLPEISFEHDGLKIDLKPIPKNPKARGQSERAVGLESFPMEFDDCVKKIKGKIRKKATRYGQIDCPFCLALNINLKGYDDGEILESLFGTPGIVYLDKDQKTYSPIVRKRDGLWMGPKGPVNTRVSGVLFSKNLSPWNLRQNSIELIHNPWAKKTISGKLCKLDQTILIRDALEKKKGISPNMLLSDTEPESG